MYRMVVVDDEKVEREGVIKFIDWAKHGIEIVGEARNGLEGLEVVRNTTPNIVLTDVKMPLMNGIEMIEEAIKEFQDAIYVVFSGYGDYEYTSQAMQLGVKYYVLKPCDEEKLTKVLGKVISELQEREDMKEQRQNADVLKMLPRAKLQFFKSALTQRYMKADEIAFYEKACIISEKELFLLVFRGDYIESHLSAFVVENIFEELMDKQNILMKAELQEYVVFLLQIERTMKLERVTREVRQQFYKIFRIELQYAISDKGSLRDVYQMCQQAKRRLEIEDDKIDAVINCTNVRKLQQLTSFNELLLEYHFIGVLFRLMNLNLEEMTAGYIKIMVLCYGKDEEYQRCRNKLNEQELFEAVMLCIKDKSGICLTAGELKIERVLLLIYYYSADSQMSIQWLAKEVLYINEDYLARLFKSNMGQKMSDFLCKIRMETARKMLNYNKNCPVSELAYFTGFHEDGRYFRKVFKKYFGQTVSEYRELF
ncbi:MAG: response regulator [Suipraeoptans sp.]